MYRPPVVIIRPCVFAWAFYFCVMDFKEMSKHKKGNAGGFFKIDPEIRESAIILMK